MGCCNQKGQTTPGGGQIAPHAAGGGSGQRKGVPSPPQQPATSPPKRRGSASGGGTAAAAYRPSDCTSPDEDGALLVRRGSRRMSRRDSEIQLGLGLEATPCSLCGERIHPRLLGCCPLQPLFAPALGGVPQNCSVCRGGPGPDRPGRPARQRFQDAPEGWVGAGAAADGGAVCVLRSMGVSPAWSSCGGRGRLCEDCGSVACANCLRFADAAVRLRRWLRHLAQTRRTNGTEQLLSPAMAAMNRTRIRGLTFRALKEGLHQAMWERIDKAVERRARSGHSDPVDEGWQASNTQLSLSASPSSSTRRWPSGGLNKLANRDFQEAEMHLQALRRAVSADESVPEDYMVGLLTDAAAILSERKNVQYCDFQDAASKVVVVGDLHGQLRDLLFLLEEHGLPGDTRIYVFNGDFVDRGNRGAEVVAIIACLLILYPDVVFLNRGNHECQKLTTAYNFRSEIELKYGPGRVYSMFCRFFSTIPLATVISHDLLVVHAGPPRDTSTTLQQIDEIDRFSEVIPDVDGSMFADLVWSDPSDTLDGWKPNLARGTGILWGYKHTQRFLKNNGLRHILRSHEVFDTGFHWHHQRRVTTVFSASHYTGSVYRNEGAVIVVTPTQGGARTEMSADTWKVYEDQWKRRASSTGDSRRGSFPNDPMSPMSPGGQMAGLAQSVERKVRRELGEMISRHRHQLLHRFVSCDRRRRGVIDASDWATCVSVVTRVDAPWYYLRRSLAGEEPFDDRPGGGVRYMRFMRRFGIPLERDLSKGWFRYRLKWLANRCAQKGRFHVGQQVKVQTKPGRWKSGQTVTQMLGFRPIVAGRLYDFVEPMEPSSAWQPEKLFDTYDSRRTGRLSYGEFQALITDGLVSPMTKAEIYTFFLELLDYTKKLSSPEVSDTPGRDAFLPRAAFLDALGSVDSVPLVRDVVLHIEDPIDPDETFHMWDVWLLLRFRCLFRDLVRFHGDKRTAFAVFTGKASRGASIDRQAVRRAIGRLRLSEIAAPERVAMWPTAAAKGSRVPPDLTERFWHGPVYDKESRSFVVQIWAKVDQPSQGPPDSHVDAFIRRLSGGLPTASFSDFLRAFFVHDLEEAEDEDEDSDDEQGGIDEISVCAITPTPTGRGASKWRAKREKTGAGSAPETEALSMSDETSPAAFAGR